MRGQSNWVYARVRNNGTAPSLDAWVRRLDNALAGAGVHVSRVVPADAPAPATRCRRRMTPGTYFIGEVKVTGLAAGAEQIVSMSSGRAG